MSLVHCVSNGDGGSPLVPPGVAIPPVNGMDAGANPFPERDAARPDANRPDTGGIDADLGDTDVPDVADAPDTSVVDTGTDTDVPDSGPSGQLDPTFGGTGHVAKLPAVPHDAGALSDTCYAGAVDPSGRVLMGGVSYDGAKNNAAIVRVDTDGTIDSTFGAGGTWWKTGTISGQTDIVWGLAADAKGVLASGQSDNSTLHEVVWVLDASGALVPAFNGGGFATGPQGYSLALAVTRDASGAVYATGYRLQTNAMIDLFVWKYTSAGALDTTFGAPNGYVIQSHTAGAPATNYWDSGQAILVDGASRVVVAGSSYKDASNHSAAVIWRFTSTGALDTTFAGTGYLALTDVAKLGTPSDAIDSVVLDGAGNLVVAGSSYDTSTNPPTERGWVARVTSTGALDATFGTGGVTVFAPTVAGATAWSSARAAAVDSKGRVVVAGSSRADYKTSSLSVWRLDTAGKPDPSFGTAGAFTTTGTNGGASDYPMSVAIAPGDKPVIVGDATNAAGSNAMTAWRLTP